MIHIILYYILSVANAPTFIWFIFWLHFLVSGVMFMAGGVKKYQERTIDLNNIERDEEF